jgi:hypothetical protein
MYALSSEMSDVSRRRAGGGTVFVKEKHTVEAEHRPLPLETSDILLDNAYIQTVTTIATNVAVKRSI